MEKVLKNKTISLIVAHEINRGIGLDNKIPWFIPGELAWVAKTTKATVDRDKVNALIMGRKTWESIPEERRPLPGRLNIVISRKMQPCSDIHVFSSLDDAINFVNDNQSIEKAFIFGGASIYEEALNKDYLNELNVTLIKESHKSDTFFPPIPERFKPISVDSQDYGDTTVKRIVFKS